jgi:choline dehydrogenase-like flavoprotein
LIDQDTARAASALQKATSIMKHVVGALDSVVDSPDEGQAIAYAQQHLGTVARYERPLGSVDHEACTHAIGAMCSEELSVAALPAVYLSGPGVFPRAGAANPGLTILAVASWLAQSLRLRMQ